MPPASAAATAAHPASIPPASPSTPPPRMPRRAALGAVLRVTSGNFLEMFDFFLYGFYATYIAQTFFPSDSEYVSLMLTFVTFGAGFGRTAYTDLRTDRFSGPLVEQPAMIDVSGNTEVASIQ